MGSIYYVDMADLFRGAGLTVVECDGWEHRARSSGGFSNPPLGCQWHHTASQTSPENDTNWQTEGSDDAPIGNCTIMRDGSVWMVAAGAANTAGKGGPLSMSRGTVPLDSGNSTTWAFEVANNGVGEPWPQVQIDAYFTASNVANKRFGNKPTDLFTHNLWAPDRKIDPATAAAVQGPWKPRSTTSSGTWNTDDIRAEANRRAEGSTPTPVPPDPDEEDELTQDDIERIADAVWGRMINDPTVNKMTPAHILLGYTRGAACNADRQTRKGDALNSIAEEVWGFKVTEPTVPDKIVTTTVLLQNTRGAAANADRQTRPDDARNVTGQVVWEHAKRTLTE